jgi:hypothetical protein
MEDLVVEVAIQILRVGRALPDKEIMVESVLDHLRAAAAAMAALAQAELRARADLV